ncbi:hypothetical protein Sjap_019220 [Stephania japonica]|uniref:Binding protein n=1 Tax=Stephania japonica TaxID=461633 RepID=A0AAP0EZM9_9MAGN
MVTISLNLQLPHKGLHLLHLDFSLGFLIQRGLHSRNKKAMEFIAKGWNALQEIDRVIDYTEPTDARLHPYYRTAKESFELAMEVDNSNTHARYWLGRMHMKYQFPGACKPIGAALLVEAADMGDPDAQYELGCRLRVENEEVQSDQQAFYYLEKAVDQLHPGASYLLGAVYLTGDCVKRDIPSALWCFQKAAEKGHAGAAVAYGSLLLKGPCRLDGCRPSLEGIMDGTAINSCYVRKGAEVPEEWTKSKRGSKSNKLMKKRVKSVESPVEIAKNMFEKAVEAGCDLGLRWLERLEDEKKLQAAGAD